MAFTCIPILWQWATVNYVNANQAVCGANEWAVFTPADLAAYNAALLAGGGGSPGVPTSSGFPVLSLIEGQQIAYAIIAIWGLGFVFRAIAVFLKSSEGVQNE